ncbi:GTP-binding protein 10-like [Tropilaelaps mercedesae]|uniref:GTP-binding protein 10-like n=1 Tax=Tropilaelaps mercedesae TaxID=418985 RepID=A0A1V9XLJ8_9ACAR|nr:GTP-binding protein 10-like [Tropilaelaps mercedesae]
MLWRTVTLRCKIPSVSTATKATGTSDISKGLLRQVYKESTFIDRVRMKVTGGTGGSGYPKINGIGGRGGNVYVQTVNNVTLKNLLSKFPERRAKAGAGENSRPHVLLGKAGSDLIIQVPPADLVQPGEKFLVAAGGAGGTPRNGFMGRKGTDAVIGLFLKLIADIGFVGFPNAGKSTLLRGLSRATPKVANYPFTTIRPNVGVIEFPDFRQISLADLPGLIEGAHQNQGLGHNFLRHIERTSLLMFVIDIQGFQLNPHAAHRNAFETVMSLNKELELYKSELVHKPAILVVNKMDTENATEKFRELTESMANHQAFESLPDELRPTTRIDFKETVAIAARNTENVGTLKEKLRLHLDDLYELKKSEKDVEKVPLKLPQLVNQLV